MITNQEALWLAELAKLSINDNELDKMTAEMGEVINFASQLKQIDGNYTYNGVVVGMKDLREDEIGERYPQELLLANAGGGDKGYFPIKRRKVDGK